MSREIALNQVKASKEIDDAIIQKVTICEKKITKEIEESLNLRIKMSE